LFDNSRSSPSSFLFYCSGLIIHRTLLPTLIRTLRAHSDKPSTLPPGVPKRPADLIIQDCLLGVDPTCPPRQYNNHYQLDDSDFYSTSDPNGNLDSNSNRGGVSSGGRGLLITSRLVMDHIGGLSSTNTYKAPNSDKWRCGWLHPFHGLPEVQVVPVEGLW
jgi:hypothetical protein